MTQTKPLVRPQPVARPLALALLAIAAPAMLSAQRPTFGPTIFWESGLINAPAAFVQPLAGDIGLQFSRLSLDSTKMPAGVRKQASSNLSAAVSLWGRGEVGISVYTGDLKSAFFGKVMVVDQMDGVWRQGVLHWLPSIAIGVRNIGSEKNLNRLSITTAGEFSTAPSVYGVATRTFVVSSAADPMERPTAQVSLTAGYGTGLFKDDGGFGDRYAPSATGGMFYGTSLDFATSKYSTLSLMAEQDAWAINAGARLEVRGLRLALYAMELGAGGKASGGATTFASQKIAMSIGFQGNALTLVRGNRLDERTRRIEKEQNDLVQQARIGQQRVDALESQISALKAIASQEKNAERAELERRLREEQEALRRLQDLIKARDAAAKKPPPDERDS